MVHSYSDFFKSEKLRLEEVGIKYGAELFYCLFFLHDD